jgi:hypothetical protein
MWKEPDMATHTHTQKSAPLTSMALALVLTTVPASAIAIFAGTIAVGDSPGMFTRFVHPDFWTVFLIAFGVTELVGLIAGYKMDIAKKAGPS